jgi:hypothetical protein
MNQTELKVNKIKKNSPKTLDFRGIQVDACDGCKRGKKWSGSNKGLEKLGVVASVGMQQLVTCSVSCLHTAVKISLHAFFRQIGFYFQVKLVCANVILCQKYETKMGSDAGNLHVQK